MADKIFYSVCFGFVAGVLWRSFFYFNFYAAFLAGLVFVFLILIFSDRRILVCVFALAFSLGVFRFHLADKPAPEVFQKQIGEKSSLSGMIVEQPVEKGNGAELVVEAEDSGAKTKILLLARENDAYSYGDEINFSGKLEEPADFLTEQGKEFDYVNYLRKDGIFYVIRHPKIEVASRGGGSSIKRALFAVREKIAGALNAAIPQPESLVARALILGERASFDDSLRQAFVNTGLIHVVTISGYHVTLVAEWIMKLLGFLPMTFAAAGGIFAIFLYVIMTGGAQTAIRAGIMASLALLAQASDRVYDASRALVLAGAVMIFINPFILVFDVSFELSFLATIAVIFIAPEAEKYFSWISWKWLRNIVSLTSAAYAFVLPFILYKMGNLSLVALPTNAAVLPFIPLTMIFCFITGFTGMFSGAIAFFPGKIAYVLLRYELAVIGFFSRLPFASLVVPDFPFILVVLVYAIFFWYLFAPPFMPLREKSRARFAVPAAAFILTLAVAGFLFYRHFKSNRIAKGNLRALLADVPSAVPTHTFVPDPKTKFTKCRLNGSLPDHQCTPGAVFEGAAVEQICVRGYTQTARSVSQKLREEVYTEYGVPYPQPRGAYEVDHLIPLALGGSNDIANLWTEAAEQTPGFHEKDIVEVYLQQEVCGGRVGLAVAQRQTADDWLAVYNNLTPEEILTIKKKYGSQ